MHRSKILTSEKKILALFPKTFEQRGLSNSWIAIGIESFGAVLIALFIVIYTIKKSAKGVQKNDNN